MSVCHVLIIEDEPLIAMLIRDALEDAGATSFAFAATQTEAVAAACNLEPTVITSDIKLLEGTGPLAVEAIHRQIGPVPVLFLSGTPEDCHPCPERAHVIAKPFDRNLLLRAFRQLTQTSP